MDDFETKLAAIDGEVSYEYRLGAVEDLLGLLHSLSESRQGQVWRKLAAVVRDDEHGLGEGTIRLIVTQGFECLNPHAPGASAVIEVLLWALEEDSGVDWEVKVEVASAFGTSRLGSALWPQLVKRLVAGLDWEDDADLSRALVESIARLTQSKGSGWGDHRFEPKLAPPVHGLVTRLVSSTDVDERVEAVEELGEHPSPATAQVLANLLGDPEEEVREQVTQVLSELEPDDPLILDRLCRSMLEDASVTVRSDAGEILQRHPPTVERVVCLCRATRNEERRDEALDVLRHWIDEGLIVADPYAAS